VMITNETKENSHLAVTGFVLKNDICYVSSFSTRNFDDSRITVVDKDRSYDIVTMSGQDGRYTFELNLGAFTGIESVTSGEGNRGSVVLIKGDILSPFTQIGEKILVSDVIVQDTAWGIEALVTVDVYDCSTENQAIGTLYEGLDATDLVCKQDIYSVFIAFERANAETKSMKKHFTWNGEKISDAKALDNAYLIELARIESIIGMYTDVKDAEIVDMPSATELEATFPQISESKSENVGYDSGEMTASKVSLALSDTLFLSETEKYALFFALKNNATEELVHIGSAGGEAVSYTGGDSFKVTAEDIWLYAPMLSAGDYTLVAYIATEDGIRISKPCVLGVDSIAGAELTQENVSIVAKKASDGALVLTYSEKSDIHTELLLAGKYTYGEFFLLMGDIVYEYGMPSEDKLEKLEGEKYVSMSGDEAVIEDGVYRIKYTVNDGDSEREGYLYVKVTVDLNAERPEEILGGDNANDENGTDAPEVADSVTVEYVASEAVDYHMLVKLFDMLAAENQIHVEIREIFYYDYQTNEQVVLPESTEAVPTNVYFVELAEGGGAYFYLKFDAFEG